MTGPTFSLIDQFGTEIVLTGAYRLRDIDGLGAVPPEYTMQAGPDQDGVTITNVRRGQRTVTLGYRYVGASSAAVWTARPALANLLAELSATAHLVATFADGTVRYLDVRLAGGLSAPSRYEWGEKLAMDVVQLIAPRPDWYNPVATIWVYAVGGGDGSYVAPFAFPISFGASVINTTEIRRYGGTAKTYPIITIVGPAEDLVINNISINSKLDFTGHDIAAGETVVVDCRPGYRTVTSSTGATTLAHLALGSNLLTFHLAPPSEVLNGDNEMVVSCSGATSATEIVLQYNERFTAL